MKDPKTMAKSAWKQSWVELAILYVLTTVGSVTMLQLHALIAMVVAPFMMLAMLAGVMIFVQVTWMLVVGLERVGEFCGLRKSPLA